MEFCWSSRCWFSPLKRSLMENNLAKHFSVRYECWHLKNAKGKDLSMEADVLIFEENRKPDKKKQKKKRDWLDSKASCLLWSELKFSLRRNCCCACVGNNFRWKCSFASKEMLFSDLDEQGKKKKKTAWLVSSRFRKTPSVVCAC